MVVDVVAKVFFALEKSCQCSFSRLNFKSDYESDPLSPPKGGGSMRGDPLDTHHDFS
jgi:hypothetical protein